MSERCRSPRGDDGMTLIELLVCVLVIGGIATVLAAAVTVTLRQQADTEARVDVARWEQNLAMWLPGDLASASDISDAEGDTPCATGVCTFGSNALQLSWEEGSGTTTVAYRYGPDTDPASFVLTRVVCRAVCTSHVVLRDLAPPTDDFGYPLPWNAGDPVPDTVIDVTVPLDVLAIGPAGATDVTTRAQRVIVNVNGSPRGDGVDRSSTVSFTAGGATLGSLEPASFSGPTFLQANSGCGGPVTLIVDESGSIAGNIVDVRAGVRSFVRAFEGTPTRLQIIPFDTESRTLGTSGWNRFFDLSEPTDVTALMGADGNSGLIAEIDDGGGTNWEDALHRAFYSEDGQPYAQLASPSASTPELVVFFTDGVPTFDRLSHNSDSSPVGPASIESRYNYATASNSGSYGNEFSPRGWYRADYIVDQFRDIRLIGVGVGDAFDASTRVRRQGWPTSGGFMQYAPIPNEVFLGDLVAAGDPSRHGSGASGNYVTRRYDGGWGDVSSADLLVTNDFNQFGSALTEIALAECGGTLTVQTRDAAGQPADASVTYQVADEVVTTTRISKSGTFDVPLTGVASTTVRLVPQPLAGTGLTAQGWNCRAAGQDLIEGTDFELIEPGNPAGGVEVAVRANAAVACTMQVLA